MRHLALRMPASGGVRRPTAGRCCPRVVLRHGRPSTPGNAPPGCLCLRRFLLPAPPMGRPGGRPASSPLQTVLFQVSQVSDGPQTSGPSTRVT